MSKPIAVTDQTFEQEVLKSDLPVLVDFWAGWCAPCKVVAPVVEEIARDYDGKLKVCKVDVDTNRQAAANLGINSIPSLYLFKDGKAVDNLVGAVPKPMIAQMVDKHVN